MTIMELPAGTHPLTGDVPSARSDYDWSREDPNCPATRHSKTYRGYREEGCRCPSTIAAWEERKEWKRLDAQRRRAEAAAGRESRRHRVGTERETEDCPADSHRHDQSGWRAGCRCPSTRKYHEGWLEMQRAASAKWRAKNGNHGREDMARFNLARGDRWDAEAVVMGYVVRGVISRHTRALAVRMMLETIPHISDEQIAWRFEKAGQKLPNARTVQRIVRALNWKRAKQGLPRYRRLVGTKG